MLGLLAHGLHLALVVLGLVGVVALLLPQLRETRFSRAPAFRPPATLAEHEERVAALRRAASTGQLAAPPATAGGLPPWPVTADSAPWRAIAAVSSLAAGVVHAAVFPHHLRESIVVGVFFFAVALWQAVWAFQLSRRVTRARLTSGVLGNLALVALWATSRTIGLPFGLGREPVGGWDLAAVAWQLCLVVACVVGLRTRSQDDEVPMGRLGPMTWAWVLLSAVILVVLSLAVSHE